MDCDRNTLNIVSVALGHMAHKLVTVLTSILSSEASLDDVCPVFFGARLIALFKADGAVRPIAVGNTYPRLSSKVFSKLVARMGLEKVSPIQVSFGTLKGAEAEVRATRRFVASKRRSAKGLDQDRFLKRFQHLAKRLYAKKVMQRFPHLLPGLWSRPSNLHWNGNIQ